MIGRIVARNAASIIIRGRGILQEPDESSDPHAVESSADFYKMAILARAVRWKSSRMRALVAAFVPHGLGRGDGR